MIKLQDISKRLGDHWALLHVDLEVSKGKSLLLGGENGAGKTTLLKIISTLMQPDAGSISLCGVAISPATIMDLRPRLGIMSHASQLYEFQSGKESLSFAATIFKKNQPKQVDELLEKMGLAAYANKRISTYSAGMKRRLLMAHLLLKNPEIVLLDEPWVQLDQEARQMMDELIKYFQYNLATLVIATHDINHARSLCQSRVDLSCGKLGKIAVNLK